MRLFCPPFPVVLLFLYNCAKNHLKRDISLAEDAPRQCDSGKGDVTESDGSLPLGEHSLEPVPSRHVTPFFLKNW